MRHGAKKSAESEQLLDVALNIRVTQSDAERLDAVCAQISIATRHGIARAALRLGLQALEEDPTRLITAAAPKPKRARPR